LLIENGADVNITERDLVEVVDNWKDWKFK
jgi:hypothetical protein